MKERAPAKTAIIKKLLADPRGLLIAILVATECLTIATSSKITKVLHTLPSNYEIAGFFFCTLLVLLVCEITPKIIGVRTNERAALSLSLPLRALYIAFYPIRICFELVISLLQPKDKSQPYDILREADFLHMAAEGIKKGALHPHELAFMQNVFDLDTLEAKDLQLAITQYLWFPPTMTVVTARTQLKTHFRIPVYDGKNVVGIVYTKDILSMCRTNPECTLTSLMRPPLVVPSSIKISTLFARMKRDKTHIAIIQGPVPGLITMDAILETLLEDALPEKTVRKKIRIIMPSP